jgi:hypothetical protein
VYEDLDAEVLLLMYVQDLVAGRTCLHEPSPVSQLVYEDLDAEFLLLDSAYVCARPGCRSPPPCR